MRCNLRLSASVILSNAFTTALIAVFLCCALQNSNAAPRTPWPPIPAIGLLYGESFDEPYDFGTNQIDPTVWAESWSGWALTREQASLQPWIVPMLETNLVYNVDPERGAIRLWYMPDWNSTSTGQGSGPGQPATIAALVTTYVNSQSPWWSLVASAAGNEIDVVAQTTNGPTTLLSGTVSWQAGVWHLLTIGYTPTNSALFIDDQQVTNGMGFPTLANQAIPYTSLVIGSDLNGTNAAWGQIDELTTFTGNNRFRQVTGSEFGLSPFFDIANYYAYLSPVAALGPVTEDELTSGHSALTSGGFTPSTPDGGGGGGYDPLYSYPSNSLWLEVTDTRQLSNSFTGITIHGTVPDVAYDLLYKLDLNDTNWLTDQTVNGAENQDSTFTWVSMVDRTNLFLWARGWQDSDGQGLPDWWQLQYFGHTGVDPYADPDGDGLSNIEEFYGGSSPTGFNTPPAPRGFTAALNQSNWIATLTWQMSQGNVTGYKIGRYDPSIYDYVYYEVGITNKFIDLNFPPYTNVLDELPTYIIEAHYSLGDSDWALTLPFPYQVANWADVINVMGRDGATVLGIRKIPARATAIRLYKYNTDESYNTYLATNVDLPIGLFTNGFYTLSSNLSYYAPHGSAFYIQSVWPDGTTGFGQYAGGAWPPFVDARSQQTQNIAFVLRGSPINRPFYYTQGGTFYTAPTNYAVATVNMYAPDPFSHNYLYRNFTFAPSSTIDFNSDGGLNTGYAPEFQLANTLKYQFPGTNFAPILSPVNFPWVVGYSDPGDLGIQTFSDHFFLPAGITNWFGLPLDSAQVAHSWFGLEFFTLNANSTILRTNGVYYFYPHFETPILLNAGYLFDRRVENDYSVPWGPLPDNGRFDFSPTNDQRVLGVAVGDYLTIFGYSKSHVFNGEYSKPAYVPQHFDRAYKIGTNGSPTGTETGVLSQVGDFLPTESGPVAITTMPDINTGEIGTGVVHVIAIRTDMDRDGKIDFNFFGPDFNAFNRPFHFWVNDDNDSGDTGGNDIPGWPAANHQISNGMDGTINGTRDLVDFFPVYLDMQSLLQALPTNISSAPVTVWLRNDDEALNYLDPTGYVDTDLSPTNTLAYLTESNVIYSIVFQGGVRPQTYQITSVGYPIFQTDFINKIRTQGKGMLLIEARKPTYSPLVVEVHQGNTVIARASLYLHISPVEQMFRQKNLVAETFRSTNSYGGYPDRLTDADVPNEPETSGKNFVFLHGYSNNPDQARGTFSETFKRMFWSGSHARFYGVTWFGSDSQGNVFPKGSLKDLTPNYHTNAYHAFQTAPFLANFLATLTNGPITVAAHSLGNMVTLSALSDWAAPIANYFMIDAAVPVEAIQGNAPQTNAMVFSDWAGYTNRVFAHDWNALFDSSDARSLLTWSNRLNNFRAADVYNFYSSGEEVLRAYPFDPPEDLISSLLPQLIALLEDAKGSFAWVWQEKAKGRAAYNEFLGSNHGGWKFNDNSYGTNTPNGIMHMSPQNAALLSTNQLRTNSFFSVVSDPLAYDNFDADAALLGVNGANYAQTNRNRILSDAIPALTLPIGANAVAALDVRAGATRNFNMNTLYESGWPVERMQTPETNNWHHSDFKEVAYPFTYRLFTNFVNFGSLK